MLLIVVGPLGQSLVQVAERRIPKAIIVLLVRALGAKVLLEARIQIHFINPHLLGRSNNMLLSLIHGDRVP